MKSSAFALLVALITLPAAGITLNDGTTAQALVRLAPPAAPSVTSVTPTNGTLEARVSSGAFEFPQAYTVWYASGYGPTGAVYTVTADFLPADAADFNCQGGVAGWVDPVVSTMIVFYTVPTGNDRGFYVGTINYNALNPAPQLGRLFATNGVPATENPAAAKSSFAGYQASQPATFELKFDAPSAQDKQALSTATAHITARVWQGSGPSRIQVSQTLELLTDLPVPPPIDHRVGYYAVWGEIPFSPLDTAIGYLDNLTLEGGFAPTTPPTITAVLSGPNLVLSWDQPGFQLEASTDLGTTWDPVATSGTQHTEPATATRRFFRLKR
jgi:hypothetical protein